MSTLHEGATHASRERQAVRDRAARHYDSGASLSEQILRKGLQIMAGLFRDCGETGG